MDITQLKKYAITGLLVRIEAEETKLQNTKDKSRQEEIKKKIENLKAEYESLLNDIKEKV